MKKFVLLCLSIFFISGCFGGRSPDSKFFLLTKVREPEVVSLKKVSILVEPITLPDLIYKPQIVLREKDSSEISISEFNRWAEPLPDVIRQTLVDDLQMYLPNAYIKPELYTSSVFDYQFYLNVEINHFIGTFGKNALLDVWWSLKNKTGKVVVREKTVLSLPMGNTYQSYVEAQSQLIAGLAKQIAKKIK